MNLGTHTFRTIALLFALGSTAGSALGEPRSPAPFGAAACQANPTEAIGKPAPAAARSSRVRTPRVRPASQVSRNERADVTFDLRPSSDGGVEVSARNGSLVMKKTVQATGDFVLELSNDRDKVAITMSGQGITVSRGNTTVEQRRSGRAPDAADRIRRLLADSPAVLQFRAVGATLLEAEDRSPASLAVIVADALVGMLTGDVGAPRRVAKFLAHGGDARPRPVGMAIDCFYLMEQRMAEAWNDYIACWTSVWPNDFFQEICAARWFIQVESYWFGFISCSGFSW